MNEPAREGSGGLRGYTCTDTVMGHDSWQLSPQKPRNGTIPCCSAAGSLYSFSMLLEVTGQGSSIALRVKSPDSCGNTAVPPSRMKPQQQPMVQCLDLSRPESISTAGYCADVRSQANKYPQPMLYSPAKGALVTYEPPGMTGLQELQWLDNISKPRQITAKSSKSQPRSSSPDRQQQQPQQPQQQPSSPHPQSPQPPGSQHQQQAASPGLGKAAAGNPQQPTLELPQQPGHLRGLPPEAAAAVERSTLKGARAAAEAAFTAACKTERQLVSYPQNFSWGGRVKAKHSSLCRMNAGVQAIGAGVVEPPPLPVLGAEDSGSTGSAGRSSSRQVASSSTGAEQLQGACAPAPAAPAAAGSTGQSRRASSRREQADAEVAAAAAELGAKADRLLNLLDRRKQMQQQGQQQDKGHLGLQNKQHVKQGAGKRQAGSKADAAHSIQDEPLYRAGSDYLQL